MLVSALRDSEGNRYTTLNIHKHSIHSTYIEQRVETAAHVVLAGAHEGRALQQRAARAAPTDDRVHCAV